MTASAKTTLAQKTADVALTAATEVDGNQVSLHGNGQVDLATNAEDEIMTSQAVYFEIAVNGHSLAQVLGGKHWIEFPFAASPATLNSAPENTPAGSLQLLEQHGARVVPLGSRSIGGLTCSGYAVTPSHQALLAAAQLQWTRLGLSESETAVARQVLDNSAPPTISVWLDQRRQLLCELDAAILQVGTGPSAGSGSTPATESTQMVLTFTHYGVPVDITPPAPADTLSVNSDGTLRFQPAGQS